MDSSKINEGSEECSSSESGWTMYIGSPDDGHDHAGDEDDDDDVDRGERGCKKIVDAVADVESDDSMASDASSGPSDQGHLYGYRNRGFGHADESKYVDKKHYQQEEKKKKKKQQHHEQIKAEKDKKGGNRANSAGRSKKV